MKLPDLATDLARQFQRIYGRPPRWFVAAPGRVNVIGEHTDYNDGFVLPMAIERYCVMAADISRTSQNISIHDEQVGEKAVIDISKPVEKGNPKWSNYVRGVIAGFQNRGVKIPALDVLMLSTVPLGGGLSSSAALEVCTATLLESATGKKMDPVEKALLCQKAEHEFAGVPCGIMDQFISVNDPSVELLIANTNVRHELGSGEYAVRRSQCEEAAKILGVASLRDATAEMLEQKKSAMSDIVFRRARHVIGENERTVSAAEGVRNSNWPTVGQLMYASHRSLRDDYEVSCKELDAVVEIAEGIGESGGVFGCRM